MLEKRILYICPNSYRGGAEQFVLKNCELHLKSGQFKPLILFYSNGPMVLEAKSLGVEFYVLPFAVRLSRPLSVFKALFFLFSLIRKKKINLVHSTMSYSHILSWLPALLTRTPEVWFQHGPVGGLLDKLAKFFPFKKVLFNSQFLQTQHNKLFGPNFEGDQIIIPLGVEIGEDKGQYENNTENSNLLWVGRITESKGLHVLIEALADFKVKTWRLSIVGGPPQEKDRIYFENLKNSVLQNENLKDRVTFHGEQSVVTNFYESSDLLVHSALVHESFGLVVAEAMAHGLLVIGSQHGGVAELLKEGRGVLFDSFNKNRVLLLGQSIEELLNRPKTEKEIMRKKAFDYVSENHSFSKMNQSLERVYLGLLD